MQVEKNIFEMVKAALYRIPLFQRWKYKLNNVNERNLFVGAQLEKIAKDSILLDAGCGSQRFRKYCGHLNYKSQDFGQYTTAEKPTLGSKRSADPTSTFDYGPLDYIGDIWEIDEVDQAFDAVLCTEVLEHVPYPIETIQEFSRIIRPGGKLILTAPSNCLRHMDPFFFYSGFSDRWYQKVLVDNGFKIVLIEAVGDYYSWMGVQVARTAMAHSLMAKLVLFPSFVYYFNKRKSPLSVDTLCMGYHVVAERM